MSRGEDSTMEKLNQSRFGVLDYRNFYDDERRKWTGKRFSRGI